MTGAGLELAWQSTVCNAECSEDWSPQHVDEILGGERECLLATLSLPKHGVPQRRTRSVVRWHKLDEVVFVQDDAEFYKVCGANVSMSFTDYWCYQLLVL